MDEMEVRAALALNIKALRGCRNWSQADLAEKSSLSVVYISDIERCNKWPYLDTLIKLANAFKVEVYELLKPEDISTPRVTAVIHKYSEEVNAIMTKAFESAGKNASQSLVTLRDKYLKKQ